MFGLNRLSWYYIALFWWLTICTFISTNASENDCLRYNGTCVDSCPPGLYILERDCVPTCPPTFGVGRDSVTCQNCTLDPSTGSCLHECPLASYPGGDFHCLPCNPVCLGCIGPAANQCLECAYVKSNRTCIVQCPPTFMIHNKECVPVCPNITVHVYGDVQCLDECPPTAPYKLESEALCLYDCEYFIFNGSCMEFCPNSTVTIPGNKTCFPQCPTTHPYKLGMPTQCVKRCPRERRYSLNGECVSVCPESMKFSPRERKCLDDCPKNEPLVFNQVCMVKCPPGTYRTFEETAYHCLPYVGLKGIAAFVACVLVLLGVIFGICMSKQYNIVRKTEEGITSMVNESEKSLLKEESGRYSRSATIGLIHVHSERRSSAAQPLLATDGQV